MCVLWTNIWGPVRGPHYEGLLSKNYLFKRTFSVGTRKCPHNFNRPHFAGVFSYECPRKCATVRAHTHTHTHTHARWFVETGSGTDVMRTSGIKDDIASLPRLLVRLALNL